MAINPETQYPGKIAPSTPDYPYGAARNITVPGDGTGTPWEAALVNDLFGWQQAILSGAGIVPSGSPETVGASQYLDALKKVINLNNAPVFASKTDLKSGVTLSGAAVDFSALAGAGLLTITKSQDTAVVTHEILTAAAYGATPDGEFDFYVGGGTSYVAKYRSSNYIYATTESEIIIALDLFLTLGVRAFVPDMEITFSQEYSYPVNHLVGLGRLDWNGRTFDVALASGNKALNTLGHWAAKMNAGEDVRVGCIGDSTTDGFPTTGFTENPFTLDADGKKDPTSNTNHSDIGAPNAWPTKMRTMLRDYHGSSSIQVFNGGYGGQSMNTYTPSGKPYETSWPYKYFEKIFFDNASYGDVDIVFISFGLNGAVSTDPNRVNDMMRGLELLVYKVKGYGAVPVILTPDAVLGKSPTNYQTKSREEFCPAFIEYAAANDLDYFDVWTAERKFWANNNIYKFRQNMTDGVHQGDDGHQFKAGFLAHNFMGAVVRLEQSMESVFLNEREAHHEFLNNGQASGGDLRYGGFSIFDVNNRAQASTWVWCESADYDVVMRDFGIQYSASPTALADLPNINVRNAVGYDDGAYLDKFNSHGGRQAKYQFPAETPNIVGKLRYGLNRVDNVGPLGSNVSGAYLGYLQFMRDLRNSSRELFANQLGPQPERAYLPRQAWIYNPVESGVVKVYTPASEDWAARNLVNWANAGDAVTLYLEVNMTQDVGLPICDGQTDTGRSGLVLYQSGTGFLLFEHQKLDNGTLSFDALGTVTTTHPAETDNKVKIRLTASPDGLDQTIEVFNGWGDSVPNATIQRSVARPSDGAFRSAGVIGGLWSGNGEPVTAVSVEIKHCLIERAT